MKATLENERKLEQEKMKNGKAKKKMKWLPMYLLLINYYYYYYHQIYIAQPLTEEEEEERKSLYADGFTNWSKKDFTAFVNACAKFGR